MPVRFAHNARAFAAGRNDFDGYNGNSQLIAFSGRPDASKEAMAKSDITFGSEFSPAVIDLPVLLELVEKNQPKRDALQSAIDKKFFPGKGKNADPKKTLADNTILSLRAYGIINISEDDVSQYGLTDFGQALYQARKSQGKLRDMMGQHCLTELPGLVVVNCIQDMIVAGDALKKITIIRALRERGLHYPENGKHLNVLRQWLQFAGVLNPNQDKTGEGLWTPNEKRLVELIGVGGDEIEKLSDLTPAQFDFARAFALMGVDESTASSVRDYAVTLYGTLFPEGGLPQSVLKQLEEADLLTMKKTTSGRGAKSHVVRATKTLKNKFLLPILEQCRTAVGPGFKQLVRMSYDDILKALQSKNTHEKGVALEALAFHMSRLLDLEFVRWRHRASQTGGAEVDVLVEGARLIFSRWQIQCKNTKTITVDHIAKEVGVATAMRTNVVMVITTGSAGPQVRGFAAQVMQNTPMQVIIIEGKHLKAIQQDRAMLIECLNHQARQAMSIKRGQVVDE